MKNYFEGQEQCQLTEKKETREKMMGSLKNDQTFRQRQHCKWLLAFNARKILHFDPFTTFHKEIVSLLRKKFNKQKHGIDLPVP